MYCKFCGNEVDKDAKFCGACGSIVSDADTPGTEETFIPEMVYPAHDPAIESTAKKSLIFGIISLAVASFSGLISLIFAIIGRGQAKKHAELNGGSFTGVAKVGKILSTIGIPLGILCIVYQTIAFIAGFISALAEQGLI